MALCAMTVMPACGEGDGCPDIEEAVLLLQTGTPDRRRIEECLRVGLARATPEELCNLDLDENGRPAAVDLLNLATLRVAQAGEEQPMRKTNPPLTTTEYLLQRVGASCPDLQDAARFTYLMFKVAQAAEPAVAFLAPSSGPGALDFSAVLPLLTSLLDPTTKCSDGGFAMCGRDVSKAVEAMGESIYSPHVMPSTIVTIANDSYDLGGTYNEPAFRLLAATGELTYAILYFLAAHIDLTSIISEATSLMSGLNLSCEANTAGQFLGSLDSMDRLLIRILETPTIKVVGTAQLVLSAEAVERAARWLTGGHGAESAVLRSLTTQIDEGLGIRLVNSGDFRLGACDSIQFNLGLADSLFSDYYDSEPAEGCTEPVPPRAIQFAKTTPDGTAINYDLLLETISGLLDKLGRSALDPSIGFSFADLNPILSAEGDRPIPALAEIYPGVLFRDGLSMFAPLSSGSGETFRAAVEAEVNQDAPTCPEGKSESGEWVCKNAKGEQDYSGAIYRGDADHFSRRIAADHIFVTEELLDLYKASPTDFFRKARGGGYLPYIEPKHPDLRGLLRVDEGVLLAVTDETKPVCDRFLAPWLTGRFVSTDARTLNALLSFAVLESKLCENEALDTIGDTFFSCGGTSLEGLSCASSFDFSCEGDYSCEDEGDMNCSPDLSDLDFGCDSSDFDFGCPAQPPSSASASLPMCMLVDARSGVSSVQAEKAIRRLILSKLRPKATTGRLASYVVNFGVFLAPLLIFPLLRKSRPGRTRRA
ncbi:MAG: hypothetical protein HYY13_09475 [Nitrospirae bacterium]|nr:hypothetical protein [Nitrospirota bacterium]